MTLGAKPALFVWGMKDFAFAPGQILPRMKSTFPDHVLVELPAANHFMQEDAPDLSPRRSSTASADGTTGPVPAARNRGTGR